jgi:hypothetical protein
LRTWQNGKKQVAKRELKQAAAEPFAGSSQNP